MASLLAPLRLHSDLQVSSDLLRDSCNVVTTVVISCVIQIFENSVVVPLLSASFPGGFSLKVSGAPLRPGQGMAFTCAAWVGTTRWPALQFPSVQLDAWSHSRTLGERRRKRTQGSL